MSEHENNKMEAWLKAYRQQRRDQWNEDPVELDEPTRAMLMAEVRRQNPVAAASAEASTEPAPATFGWLRWALGGMTAAIVALGITSLSNFNQPTGPNTMAHADIDSTEAENEIKLGTADAPVERMNRDENANAKAMAETETASGEMGAMAVKGSQAGSPGFSGNVQAVPSLTAPAQPTSRPASAQNIPTRQNMEMANGNYYNHARELQLNFAQQSRSRSGVRSDVVASRMARQKELPKPVLVNFELKRVGNTIRVVDGDGSVYTGTVINEEALSEAEERQQLTLAEPGEGSEGDRGGEGAGIASGGAGPAGGNVAARKPDAFAKKMRRGSQAFFRVQGTNKTLKQVVILEATLDNTPVSFQAAKSRGPGVAAAPSRPRVAPPKESEVGGEDKLPEADGKNLNRNLGAIRAIARMRVLGNARIGKENYPVDAYLDIKAAGKISADEIKKK